MEDVDAVIYAFRKESMGVDHSRPIKANAEILKGVARQV